MFPLLTLNTVNVPTSESKCSECSHFDTKCSECLTSDTKCSECPTSDTKYSECSHFCHQMQLILLSLPTLNPLNSATLSSVYKNVIFLKDMYMLVHELIMSFIDLNTWTGYYSETQISLSINHLEPSISHNSDHSAWCKYLIAITNPRIRCDFM